MKLKDIIKEIAGGFDEVTYTDGEDEVMVHFDKNDNPLRAYVYKDSPLLNFDYDLYDIPAKLKKYKWKFVQSKNNPLFYHLNTNNINAFVWWLEAMGYIRTDET